MRECHTNAIRSPADDWRNRARWEAYREAVVEMIERTSTSYSPWTIVEAEDKYWGRIKTLQTLVSALEEKLGKGGKEVLSAEY